MADTPTVWGSSASPSSRPTSIKSNRSIRSSRSRTSNRPEESTPLLARANSDVSDDHRLRSPAASSLRSIYDTPERKGLSKRRWASIIALIVLCLVAIAVMILGFIAPEALEDYAMQAAVFQPEALSVDSFTSTGVRVHIQGDFVMDGSRVEKKSVRNFGRFATWMVGNVRSGETEVDVILPEYGNIVLGTAIVPPLLVNVRNHHVNRIDFLSDIEPGSVGGLRKIANDWVEGRLGQLRVNGRAQVPLKVGILSLGEKSVEKSLVFYRKTALCDHLIQATNRLTSSQQELAITSGVQHHTS